MFKSFNVSKRPNKTWLNHESGASEKRIGSYLKEWLGLAIIGVILMPTYSLADVSFPSITGKTTTYFFGDAHNAHTEINFPGPDAYYSATGFDAHPDDYNGQNFSDNVGFTIMLPGLNELQLSARIFFQDTNGTTVTPSTLVCAGATTTIATSPAHPYAAVTLPLSNNTCALGVYWTTAANMPVSYTGATLSRDANGVYSIDGNGLLKGEDAGGTAESPPSSVVTISPVYVPIQAQTSQATPTIFTVTNQGTEALNLSSVAVKLEGGYASQFTLSANNCNSAYLTVNATCSFNVQYAHNTNHPTKHTAVGITISDSYNYEVARALISSSDNAANETARRLPDVMTGVTVPALTAGTPATISWNQLGYQSSMWGQIAAFECTPAEVSDSSCGLNFADVTSKSEVMAGTLNLPANSWSYRGESAKQHDFSWEYIPTSGFTGTVVFRFYQKSGMDKTASNKGLSLVIPGGLTGAGTSFNYFDQVGRRISATVN